MFGLAVTLAWKKETKKTIRPTQAQHLLIVVIITFIQSENDRNVSQGPQE